MKNIKFLYGPKNDAHALVAALSMQLHTEGGMDTQIHRRLDADDLWELNISGGNFGVDKRMRLEDLKEVSVLADTLETCNALRRALHRDVVRIKAPSIHDLEMCPIMKSKVLEGLEQVYANTIKSLEALNVRVCSAEEETET